MVGIPIEEFSQKNLNDNFITNMNKYLINKIDNNELVTNKQLNYLTIQDELLQKLEYKGAFKVLKSEDDDSQVFLSKNQSYFFGYNPNHI